MAKMPEEGKGVLFSNDKKGNLKAPDFKGQVNVDGKIIRLSAWKRTSDYGELISLAVNTYTPNENQESYPREVKRKTDIDAGDVPW